MNCIEPLVNEHNLIRQVLEALSLAKEKLEEGERPPVEFFENSVEFARSFMLKFHHYKEEYVLFAFLAQKKNGAIDAQLESLRYQHERSRNFIIEIAGSLDGYSKGQGIQISNVLENLASYISLIRHHIHKEEHIFYPMIEKELSKEEKMALAKEIEKESSKAGDNFLEYARKCVMKIGDFL